MEFKLLYSYEEWLDKNNPSVPNSLFKPLDEIREDSAKLMGLAFKSATEGLTEEEESEFGRLSSKSDEKLRNEKYTDLYYTIVDMCLNPKGCKPDFKEIGKKQCEMVRMFYPIVVPKKEE